jgi:hypothetical protein
MARGQTYCHKMSDMPKKVLPVVRDYFAIQSFFESPVAPIGR